MGSRMFRLEFMKWTDVRYIGRRWAGIRFTAGEHVEENRASLRLWSKVDYLQQWRDGVYRLIAGAEASFLVSGVYSMRMRTPLCGFPIFRSGNKVYVYEYSVDSESLRDVDLHHPYCILGTRQGFLGGATKEMIGTYPTEWEVSLEDVVAYSRFLDQVFSASCAK